MNEIASAAARSYAENKGMHLLNLGVSGGTATAAANATAVSAVMGWLTPLAIFAGFCVSCAMFYHKLVQIRNDKKEGKLLDIKLAKEGRRTIDKG